MQFVDRTLARRLEAGEDEAQLGIADVLRRLRPFAGAESLAIAGGHAVFAGKNSPVGRTIGAGLAAPISEADVDRVEEFYGSHGAPAQFDVTPFADESLTALLHRRNYAMTELNNVMARRLTSADRFVAEVEGVEFRPCPPEDAMLWTRTMLAGFFAESQVPEGWEELIFPMALLPHSLAMTAWADGEAVGAFAGMICPQWRLLMLAGTSTLPAWRGRGLQTAAIGRRLQQGIEAGCDLAVVVTHAGTTSQRNAERMGFTLAYTKATLVGPNPRST